MDKALMLFQDHDPIPLKDFEGACIAVLGIRDSGKSNSAARLIEQFLLNRVPMVIVDVLGEYWGLKEKFPIFVVGRSAHTDIEIETPRQAAAVAVWSLEERIPIILDVSDFDDEKRMAILKGYFDALWRTAGYLRRVYQVVVEEAHNWMPQGTMTPVKPILTRIAAEGRSRGLNIIMISQRSARLDKNILTQANILLLHQVRHGIDLDVYQALVPTTKQDRSFVADKVPHFQTGQAVFVHHKRDYEVVRVLKRETYHGGVTPSMDADAAEAAPAFTVAPSALLDSLQRMLDEARKEDGVEEDPTRALKDRIQELELEVKSQDNELIEKERQIISLNEEVARLSKLVVTMPETLTLQTNAIMPYGGASAIAVPAPEKVQATARALRVQQERFDVLIKDVKGLPWQMHRKFLGWLLRRYDQRLSLQEIARYTGHSENTVKRNPPILLVKWGLLQRHKIGTRQYSYTASDTRGFLKQAYPDLDTEALVKTILEACPE